MVPIKKLIQILCCLCPRGTNSDCWSNKRYLRENTQSQMIIICMHGILLCLDKKLDIFGRSTQNSWYRLLNASTLDGPKNYSGTFIGPTNNETCKKKATGRCTAFIIIPVNDTIFRRDRAFPSHICPSSSSSWDA